MLPASYILTPRWFHKVRLASSLNSLADSVDIPGQRVHDTVSYGHAIAVDLLKPSLQVDQFPDTAVDSLVRAASEEERCHHVLRNHILSCGEGV